MLRWNYLHSFISIFPDYNILDNFYIRLAESSKNVEASKAAAKTYFQDINDIFVLSQQKDGETIKGVYDLSLKHLAAFVATI